MRAAGTATARPAHRHPAWCVIDVLLPGEGWHCCSDYTEVALRLRRPARGEAGETVADKVSVFLAQGPYDIRPRLWLAQGDVAGDARLDAAELTLTEARELVKALSDAIALAAAPRPAPFVAMPGASLRHLNECCGTS
jgi:hypothetical protein